MAFYRINKDISNHPDGKNEVHHQDCKRYSDMVKHDELGYHSSPKSALNSAKNRGYTEVAACPTCIDPAKC